MINNLMLNQIIKLMSIKQILFRIKFKLREPKIKNIHMKLKLNKIQIIRMKKKNQKKLNQIDQFILLKKQLLVKIVKVKVLLKYKKSKVFFSFFFFFLKKLIII